MRGDPAPLDAANGGSSGGASFSLANRIYRVVWQTVWLVMARWTPPQLHAWRHFLLRMFGAQIGAGTRIYGSAVIWFPPNLSVGDHSVIGPRVRCYNQGAIAIGSNVTISQGAHLCASSHDVSDRNFQLTTWPVTIEDHCWVAADGFVGPGVTMASGSILGARGVLLKNSEDHGIYRGNPAIWVKQRVFRN